MILNWQKSCLFLWRHWESSSWMHIGETLTHQITFRNVAGSLVELCFERSSVVTNEWTTCGVTWRHESEAQKTLTAVASQCLPMTDPCLAHIPFSHLSWNIIDLIKLMRINIHIYISNPWSDCNVQFRSSLKPRDWPRFPITWSDRDIPS